MSFIGRRNILADSRPRLGATVLTDDQIRRFAPSAFAVEAHESRSERFAVIPTGNIITAMRAEGFQPVFATQSVARDPSKRAFTKHMIRFRHMVEGRGEAAGESIAEVVLVNANDGSSAYKVMAGVHRIVCLNGLIVSERETGTVSVHHKGDVRRAVIEGSFEVLDESRRALTATREWAGVDLSRDEQMAMAEAAHVIRFADADGKVTTPILPAQLLAARRSADRRDDLWTTFNRLQENVIRGGLTAMARDERGRPTRRVSTKEVRGIDSDVRLNRALWTLGERMAALKGAA